VVVLDKRPDRLRLLVLVLAARARPYPSLVRTIKRTWASTRVEGIEVLFFYGGRTLSRRGKDLSLAAPDDLARIGHKILACLEYALQTLGPAVVFRTNCSSYVDLPNLGTFVRDHISTKEFYGGKIGVHDGIRFASGSGYFLSSNLVELVLTQRDAWDHSLPDDVALGSLLGRLGVEPQEVPRQDLTAVGDLPGLDLSQFHFRCKSTIGGNRDDRILLLAVHRAFCRLRGASLAARTRTLVYFALIRIGRSVRWRLRRRSAA
jgi:hypothetical protein